MTRHRRVHKLVLYSPCLLFLTMSTAQAVPNAMLPEHEVIQLINERHYSPPPPMPVSSAYTTSKFSYLMQSQCLPESNGYFGSTAGTPAIFQYGYSVEAIPGASIDPILSAVDNHIIDSLLSQTFPQVCGGSRRKLVLTIQRPTNVASAVITGYQFGEKAVETALTCVPQHSVNDTCNYYKNTVKVFGINLDNALIMQTMSAVELFIPDALSLAAKNGAVNISASPALMKQLSSVEVFGTITSSTGPGSRSPGEKVALGSSVIILCASILLLGVYWHVDRKQKKKKKQKKRKDQAFDVKGLYLDPTTSGYSHAEKHFYFGVSGDTDEDTAVSSEQPYTIRRGQGKGGPVIVEFRRGFDPDRDRVIIEMEEESSVMPDYAKHLDGILEPHGNSGGFLRNKI